MPALNRPLRCSGCGTATRDFSEAMATAAASVRVCAPCEKKNQITVEAGARGDAFFDDHEAARAIYRNYFCTACGVATQELRMAMVTGDRDQRLCLACEQRGVPPGTINKVREQQAGDGENHSPLGGVMPYQLHRSERQRMCMRCGVPTRNFSVEMENGDAAKRTCLDCEAELAAELDAEDRQQQQQQHHQQAANSTPDGQRLSTPRYDRVSPARVGTLHCLTAAGCIKRAMRCAQCKVATKNYTIDALKLEQNERICIDCLSKS